MDDKTGTGYPPEHEAFLMDTLSRMRERPKIITMRQLEHEITRVLIYSLAYQSNSFRGSTVEEMESIKKRAEFEFQNNPIFKAFIKHQLMEIMNLINRYEPEH